MKMNSGNFAESESKDVLNESIMGTWEPAEGAPTGRMNNMSFKRITTVMDYMTQRLNKNL